MNTGVTSILLVGLMIFIVFKIVKNTILSERSRKNFSSSMKTGDKVRVPISSDIVSGEILEVVDDTVKVVVSVSKSNVYPKQ
jgi:preprotein translocase subunit YajC